jgi:predicted PurR-regulated permease PerM
VSGSSDDRGSGWWKPILIALGAAAAAVIAWGALSPEPRPSEEEREPEGPEAQPEEFVLVPAERAERQPPPWVRPTILWAIAVVVGVVVLFAVLGILRQIVLWLLLALFFSFALEPAVNRLARRGWRRGSATGLLLALTFVLMIGIGFVFVVSLVRGAAAIAANIPEWSQQASEWLSDTFGVTVSTDGVSEGATSTASALNASATEPAELLLGFTSSLVGGIFAMFTVGMFIFYMVAEGPRFKRAVLSFFSRQRQEELVSIWEAAIDKTGGYFYSKLLLTLINGGLFFVVLLAVGMPFTSSLALATFQGVVAEFIPIVGTYIAAVVPLVTVLFTLGNPETLIVLIYVLIYQQVENYLLAPRLQSRTMQLHPAVAFGAALAGGAIGGLLWAFLAIPFAATVQASASLWFERHEVLETELTAEQARVAKEKPAREHRSIGERAGRFLRRSRGWLRRREPDEEPGDEEPGTDELAPEPAIEGPEPAELGA